MNHVKRAEMLMKYSISALLGSHIRDDFEPPSSRRLQEPVLQDQDEKNESDRQDDMPHAGYA